MPSPILVHNVEGVMRTFSGYYYRWLWRDDPNRLFGNVDPGGITSGRCPFYFIEIENINTGSRIQVLQDGVTVYERLIDKYPDTATSGFWYTPDNDQKPYGPP